MPEFRRDPIIGRWVIINTERGKRPLEFRQRFDRPPIGLCPFCPGNEDMTPAELMAYRPEGLPANGPGWTLRVVPNKFPVLDYEGGVGARHHIFYDKMNGVGTHDVVIETPEHNLSLSTMTKKRVEEVFWAYRERINEIRKDSRFKYVLVFKNQGGSAGASLEHSHSQIIALPIVPKRVQEEVCGAVSHFKQKGRCVFCDIILTEEEQQRRVILDNQSFIAITPYASRFPFETWILPKKHDSCFEEVSSAEEFSQLAEVLREVLARMDYVLQNPSYNYVIHSSPLNDFENPFYNWKVDNPFYHWHIEIMPRFTSVAGFEWGTGFYINPIPPEEAAQLLRENIRQEE